MKRFALAAFLVGVTLFSVLIAWSGFHDVSAAVLSAGWATAIVVLARAVAIVVEGVAWQMLFPPGQGLGTSICILLRFVREAVNQLLPVAAVGGDVVGARLATFWRTDGALAGATIFADVAIQAGTQFLFAVAGLVILFVLKGDGELVRYAALGLGLGAAGIGAFLFIQGRQGSRWIGGALQHVGGGRDWAGVRLVERLWERLGAVYDRPRQVAGSAFLHLVVWVFGSVEVYVALHAMGYPITVAEAIVIESLGQAVRGAAFAIPGGLGVQEGGYVALCALFGIPPGPALALSLVKRVADLVLGLPFLAVWQVLEGRHALRATPPVPDPAASSFVGRGG
ncbi:lysylphosphatidylglycerol synthase domain-containing protein [uncultured Enterovirga sp.]|uniref:lysylphosphatidylglycerol synthase domain-containing protein n=1 Tax=uncultured Enterovirga sp. TaxID=2026352 RepID=UPI0035C94FB0